MEERIAENKQRFKPTFYVAAAIGLGYLSLEIPDMDPSKSTTFRLDAAIGERFTPGFALGVGLIDEIGLEKTTLDYSPGLYAQGHVEAAPNLGGLYLAPVLFLPDSSVHLDARAGLGFMKRVSSHQTYGQSTSTGLLLGAGCGWSGESKYADLEIGANVLYASANDGSEAVHGLAFGILLGTRLHSPHR